MSTTTIVEEFVLRSLFWGILLGPVVGGLFQLAFFRSVTPWFLGIVLGFIGGMVLGVLNGIVLGVVTARFFAVLDNVDKYRSTISRTATTLTFITATIGYYIVIYFLTLSSFYAALIGVMAAVFASLAAFYASRNITQWYIRAFRPRGQETKKG
jgi:MFS family permease